MGRDPEANGGQGKSGQKEQMGERTKRLRKSGGRGKEERRVEVNLNGGKKWGGGCPKEGRGRERPRENKHKKDIRKAFQHDPPFLCLPGCSQPLGRSSAGRTITPHWAHSPSGAAASGPMSQCSQLLLSADARVQLELSGPPWMQRHQFLSVSMRRHLARTQLSPDVEVMGVAQNSLAWEGFWRGRLACRRVTEGEDQSREDSFE